VGYRAGKRNKPFLLVGGGGEGRGRGRNLEKQTCSKLEVYTKDRVWGGHVEKVKEIPPGERSLCQLYSCKGLSQNVGPWYSRKTGGPSIPLGGGRRLSVNSVGKELMLIEWRIERFFIEVTKVKNGDGGLSFAKKIVIRGENKRSGRESGHREDLK